MTLCLATGPAQRPVACRTLSSSPTKPSCRQCWPWAPSTQGSCAGSGPVSEVRYASPPSRVPKDIAQAGGASAHPVQAGGSALSWGSKSQEREGETWEAESRARLASPALPLRKLQLRGPLLRVHKVTRCLGSGAHSHPLRCPGPHCESGQFPSYKALRGSPWGGGQPAHVRPVPLWTCPSGLLLLGTTAAHVLDQLRGPSGSYQSRLPP